MSDGNTNIDPAKPGPARPDPNVTNVKPADPTKPAQVKPAPVADDGRLVEREYQRAFTVQTPFRTYSIPPGKQKVPQEVADHWLAKAHETDPEYLKDPFRQVTYGEPGHEVKAFEERYLGPEVPMVGVSTTAPVHEDFEDEVPEPGEKGPSTRVAGGRRRAIPSD